MRFHNSIIQIGLIVIVISCLIAWLHIKVPKPKYFKYIFLFIHFGIILSLNSIFLAEKWGFVKRLPFLLQEILLLVQYSLLTKFFISILTNPKTIKKLKIVFFLSLLFMISLMLVSFYQDINLIPSSISSLFLLVYCAFFVKDLMASKPTLILEKFPAFWIVMGIFFYSCISFPIVTLIKFIPKNNEYINIRSYLFSVINISLIVLYALITKGYLCLKRQPNS